MIDRRFHAGYVREVDGIMFRVVPGKKGPNDLRLEWDTTGRGTWRPMSFSPVFFMADFFCENEDIRYPPPKKGGGMLLSYVRLAAREGWSHAVAQVYIDRAYRGRQCSLELDV